MKPTSGISEGNTTVAAPVCVRLYVCDHVKTPGHTWEKKKIFEFMLLCVYTNQCLQLEEAMTICSEITAVLSLALFIWLQCLSALK